MTESVAVPAEDYSSEEDFLGHPKGLYVCFTTELWERFSFYGMKYLLLLYLTKYHLFTDAMGLDVLRLGGASRYETAVLIALEIERHEIEAGRVFTKQVFIARGDSFPDALSVSPLAYALKAPILLVRPTSLPPVVRDFILYHDFDSQLVAGQTAAVSAAVEAELIAAGGYASVRVGGLSRYETSALVAQYGVDMGWATWSPLGIATGVDFPDALTGGVAIGEKGGVLVITTPTVLHPELRGRIIAHKPEIFDVQFFGGPRAISEDVANEVKALLE